jgi:hypothetical protein
LAKKPLQRCCECANEMTFASLTSHQQPVRFAQAKQMISFLTESAHLGQEKENCYRSSVSSQLRKKENVQKLCLQSAD